MDENSVNTGKKSISIKCEPEEIYFEEEEIPDYSNSFIQDLSKNIDETINNLLTLDELDMNCGNSEANIQDDVTELVDQLPVENDKLAVLCIICQLPVSEEKNSVSCSGLCGKCQHISCLNFSAEDNTNIIWNCNDCLNKDENESNIKFLGGFDELRESPESYSSQVEENGTHFGCENENFILISSPQSENKTHENSSSEENNGKINLTDKDDCSENINLNNKIIEGEVTDPLEEVTEPDKDDCSGNVNLNNITIEGEVTDPLSPPFKRRKLSKLRKKALKARTNVHHVILENMTKFNNPKMFDSLGYSYTLRSLKSERTVWRCTNRKSRGNHCNATVFQNTNTNSFIHKGKHIHSGNLKIYDSAKLMFEKKSSQNTEKFNETNENTLNLESNTYMEKDLSKSLRNKETYSQKIGKINKLPGNEVNMNDNCPSNENINEPERTLRVKLFRKAREQGRTENKPEHLENGVMSKKLIKNLQNQKSVYILLDNQNDASSKLFDQTLGFTYNLYKTMERQKVWLCTKSDSVIKCEAAVKQIGNYFVRTKKKHKHKSSKRHLLLQKHKISNKSTEKVRFSRSLSRVTSANRNLEQDCLESDESSTVEREASCNRKKRKSSTDRHGVSVAKKLEAASDNDSDKQLLSILDSLHNAGVYLTRKVILFNVGDYVNEKNLNVTVNKNWLPEFYEKYEQLLCDKYIQKSVYRDIITLSVCRINSLYTNLEILLQQNDLEISQMLSKANSDRIFNCDIMELVLNDHKGNTSKVREEKKDKYVFNVFCCVSASGRSTKPVIINKGENIPNYKTAKDFKDSYSYVHSSTGDFTSEMLLTWLSQDFVQYLIENNLKTPVLLLVNGNHIQISWKCLNFAKNNGIILFQLPLFLTRSCQPLSYGILQAIRKQYRVFEDKLNCNSNRLSKVFPTLIVKALNKVDMVQRCKECFEATGICPLDEYKLTSTRLSAQEVKHAVSECDSAYEYNFRSEASNDSIAQHNIDKLKHCSDSVSKSPTTTDTDSQFQDNDSKASDVSEDQVLSSPNKSLSGAGKINIDKLSVKMGYKLALSNMEKLFNAVLEPETIEIFKKKLDANEEFYDSNFAVWRGLQQLKKVPDLFDGS